MSVRIQIAFLLITFSPLIGLGGALCGQNVILTFALVCQKNKGEIGAAFFLNVTPLGCDWLILINLFVSPLRVISQLKVRLWSSALAADYHG